MLKSTQIEFLGQTLSAALLFTRLKGARATDNGFEDVILTKCEIVGEAQEQLSEGTAVLSSSDTDDTFTGMSLAFERALQQLPLSPVEGAKLRRLFMQSVERTQEIQQQERQIQAYQQRAARMQQEERDQLYMVAQMRQASIPEQFIRHFLGR